MIKGLPASRKTSYISSLYGSASARLVLGLEVDGLGPLTSGSVLVVFAVYGCCLGRLKPAGNKAPACVS